MDKFLRKGYDNDADAVAKLQKFLNDYTHTTLATSGIFDQPTEDALKAFQLAHKDAILDPWHIAAPTGIFYLTTQTAVNNIMCPSLNLTVPSLVPFSVHPAAPKHS
ncbi:MAG: peptidoglycan-binding domain-containing protein [bacterium]